MEEFQNWSLIEKEPNKTVVVMEEVSKGVTSFVGQVFFKKSIKEKHQLWLQGLQRMAQKGTT